MLQHNTQFFGLCIFVMLKHNLRGYVIAKPQAVSNGDGKLSDAGNNRAGLN
jgi:hypothetical protein